MTTMNFERKGKICDALIQCSELLDPEVRQRIFMRLPFIAAIDHANTPAHHIRNAIDVAERWRHGLATLMDAIRWGVGLKAQFRKACALLQEFFPWTVEWDLVFELRDILGTVHLDADPIASAYRTACGLRLLPEAGPKEDLLSLCLFDLADLGKSPLRAFITGLLPHAGEKCPELEDWLKALPVASALPVRAPSSEAPSLLIKVEKDANTPDFHVAAWYKNPSPVPLRDLEAPFPRATLEDAFTICWRQTRRLMEGDVNAQQRLAVEVFLPLELLADKTLMPDRLEVKFGIASKSLIGAKVSVVLRSWDRAYDPEARQDTWGEWHRKWNARPAPPRPFDRGHLFWVCTHAEFLSRQYEKLGRDSIVLISLAEVASGEAGISLLARLIDSGTPIALWRREPGAEAETDADRKQMHGLLCENHSDELPRLLLQKRQALSDDPLWKHVVLLWEDPQRLPPDLVNAGVP